MAEEYKNVPEHETPKIATEDSSETKTEVKDRGLFNFLGKKEEVKPQETPLESEFEHKTQISEPEPAPFVVEPQDEEVKENKHTLLEELHEKTDEDEENKPSLIEKLHQKHEEEEDNKPSLLSKLHRSNSSSSSSSDEEGEDGEKKKKEKKKIVEGEEEKEGVVEKIKEKLPGHDEKSDDVPVVTTMPTPHSVEHHETEEEKKGLMDKIKEKLPGHSKKPEDSEVVNTTPLVETATPITDEPAEKKGIMEKIKEKLPGYHTKTSEEEEKKEKVSA